MAESVKLITFAAKLSNKDTKNVKMKELYYNVAEHVFILKTGEHDSLLGELRQYEPFLTDPTNEVTFSMEIVDNLPVSDFQEEMRQEDEGQTIVVGRLDGGETYFEFW